MRPALADEDDLCQFHCEDYISFLKNVVPENEVGSAVLLFGILCSTGSTSTGSCTGGVWIGDGLSVVSKSFSLLSSQHFTQNCTHNTFPQSYAGASIGGAHLLNFGKAQTVINWSGGMHHAKKAEVLHSRSSWVVHVPMQAAGFCYVNDIVLAILELLKYHHRVLYLDIDVHHGDGVEEAFLTTSEKTCILPIDVSLLSDRVLTVSFHKYGNDYYPTSGALNSIGSGKRRICLKGSHRVEQVPVPIMQLMFR